MKIHIVTIGKPKLHYASLGWNEYMWRLEHFHTVRTTHLADKYAHDAAKILDTTKDSYRVALVIGGKGMSSPEFAKFLTRHAEAADHLSFIIGGPEGLPDEVIKKADFQWSLGPLTLPHDLAMVVTLEALYRASTINAGVPYHK